MATNLNSLNFENFKFLNNDKPKYQQIVNDLIDKKSSILSLVESLAVVLTNNDKNVRKEGVAFMSWILSQLPQNFLTDKELSYFSAFYSDRLVDHHDIVPVALQGILSILKMGQQSETTVSELMHKIFQFIVCQSQLAQDRKTLYQIFQTCSEIHFPAIQKTGPDFLYGVLTSMEGETDPQNLLYLFSFLPSLVQKLNIDHLTENLFEVFSIYFPVDFTTVKKDDVVITREDLSEGLSNCLTATPKLSEESLSLILEKLDSTLKVAKIDSYKLLSRCCRNLEASQLESSIDALWKIMQRDLIPVLDVNIQTEALNALGSIISAVNTSEIILNKLLDDIIIAIRGFIGNPEDTLFNPAMKIFEAIHTKSAIARKRIILELQVLCRSKERNNSEIFLLISAITPFITDDSSSTVFILPLCFQAIKSNWEKLIAVGFLALEKQSIVLTEELKDFLNVELISIVKGFESVPCECRQFLKKIAELHNQDFVNFYQKLENLLANNEINISVFLEISAAVVQNPNLTDGILGHYLVLGESEYATFTLESLLTTCENAADFYVKKLYSVVLRLTGNREKRNLPLLAHLLKNVIAERKASEQLETLNDLNVFEPGVPVILMEGALSALRPEIHDPRLFQLIPLLITTATRNQDLDDRESAGRLLATFVNKFPQNEALNILNSVDDFIDENSVKLFCWIIKGSVLRGLPGLEVFLEKWFLLLDNNYVGRVAAVGTGQFLENEMVYLNESCHCTIKFLYKQRLFSYLPRLTKTLQTTTDPQIRNNYLLAAINLAAGVTLQILLTEESAVAVAVSQALQSNEPLITEPSLDLLKKLLEKKSALFTDHITSLLPVLLKLVHLPNALRIRQKSLQCLFLAGCYPTHLTLPYRSEVIRELLNCLDDRKRIVRAEAVKTRSRWFLIGAVGEDLVFS